MVITGFLPSTVPSSTGTSLTLTTLCHPTPRSGSKGKRARTSPIGNRRGHTSGSGFELSWFALGSKITDERTSNWDGHPGSSQISARIKKQIIYQTYRKDTMLLWGEGDLFLPSALKIWTLSTSYILFLPTPKKVRNWPVDGQFPQSEPKLSPNFRGFTH